MEQEAGQQLVKARRRPLKVESPSKALAHTKKFDRAGGLSDVTELSTSPNKTVEAKAMKKAELAHRQSLVKKIFKVR